MKYRVQLSARAEEDIDTTLGWLCRKGASSAAAGGWHARLLAAIDTLECEPRRCPLTPEAEELGVELRELLFGRRRNVYRILFIVEERTVNVVHIRHAARDALRPDDLS